jgi:branched-subunit amino acid permease
LKPYRRNYTIGFFFIVGLAIMLLSPDGVIDTVGKLLAAAGFILAGWSGRQWWYHEKQAKTSGVSRVSSP